MGPFDTLFMVSVYWVGIDEKQLFYGTETVMPKLQFKIHIAFDQSSTQTGVAVCDENGTLICVIDIINNGLPNSDMYVRMLRKWINNNLEGLDIGFIICERAEQNARQQYVKKVLQKLIGVLEDFAADYNKKCYQIDNKVWKKHFLKDERFKGRRVKTELVKPAIVERAVEIQSNLNFYYRFMKGTDSADAIGILYGFADECFVNGFKSDMKVNTIMPLTPRRVFTMLFVTLDEFRVLVERKPDTYQGMSVIAYNDNMTLEDNARRIINFFDKGAIVYTNNEKTRMVWQFTADKELTADHVMIVLRGK